MAPFPWVKMLALMACLVSQETASYGPTSYMGYMVSHLQVVDDKDTAGERYPRVFEQFEAVCDMFWFPSRRTHPY